MNINDIDDAVNEARRFIARAEQYTKVVDKCQIENGESAKYWTHPKESGALKRASMDLTRALATIRRRS